MNFTLPINSIPYYWDQLYYLYIIGVLANALVIIYFLIVKNYGKPLKNLSSYHLLIVLLALVDFLVCLILSIDSFQFDSFQPIPRHVVLATYDTLSLLSCCFLVFIAYKRYRQIVHPLNSQISKQTVLLVSLILTILIYTMNYVIFYYKNVVVMTFVESLLVHFILETVMCIMIMYYFYRTISMKIYSDVLRIDGTTNNIIQMKKKTTALHTLKWLILVYVICVVPGRSIFMVLRFLDRYTSLTDQYFAFFNHFYNAGIYVFNLNNMVNVFVYARIVDDFRSFVIDILTFRWMRRSRERNSSGNIIIVNNHA